MLDSGLEAIDIFMAVGVLAQIAELSQASGQAEFGQVRDTTKLLPEKLVTLIDELRSAGCVRYEENANGNPYGILRLTHVGEQWVASFGHQAIEFIERAPSHFKVSAPERSTRRGGKRASPPLCNVASVIFPRRDYDPAPGSARAAR